MYKIKQVRYVVPRVLSAPPMTRAFQSRTDVISNMIASTHLTNKDAVRIRAAPLELY